MPSSHRPTPELSTGWVDARDELGWVESTIAKVFKISKYYVDAMKHG